MVTSDVEFSQLDIAFGDASRDYDYRKHRQEEKRRDKHMNWQITVGESSCELQIQYHQYHDMESRINMIVPSPAVSITVGTEVLLVNHRYMVLPRVMKMIRDLQLLCLIMVFP